MENFKMDKEDFYFIILIAILGLTAVLLVAFAPRAEAAVLTSDYGLYNTIEDYNYAGQGAGVASTSVLSSDLYIKVNITTAPTSDYGMLGYILCTDTNGENCKNASGAYDLAGNDIYSSNATTVTGPVILKFSCSDGCDTVNGSMLYMSYFMNYVYFYGTTYSDVNFGDNFPKFAAKLATTLAEARADDTPVVPEPQLTVEFPYMGMIYGDFDEWRFSAINLEPLHDYKVIVSYHLASTSISYTDVWGWNTLMSTSSLGIKHIPKEHSLVPPSYSSSTTYTWNVDFYLCGDAICSIPLDHIAFVYNYYYKAPRDNYTITTSSMGIVWSHLEDTPDDPDLGAIASCVPPAGWSDFAGGFRFGLCWLFRPNDTSFMFLEQKFKDFKTVFPFSLFYQTADVVTAKLENTSIDDAKSLSLDLTLSDEVTGSSSESISLLTPTYFKDTFGVEVASWWYNIVLSIMSFLLLFSIWKFLFTTI